MAGTLEKDLGVCDAYVEWPRLLLNVIFGVGRELLRFFEVLPDDTNFWSTMLAFVHPPLNYWHFRVCWCLIFSG